MRASASPFRSIQLSRPAGATPALRHRLWLPRPLSAAAGDLSPDHESPIDSRILAAALPFIPQSGFTTTTLMSGIQSVPHLSRLSITEHTLSGLFPSGNKRIGQRSNDTMGPIKALAGCWLEDGNIQMKKSLFDQGITLEKYGIDGLRRAFEIRLQYNRRIPRDNFLEALILTLTPAEPFFGIPLPFEPPHILPYGSHALDVSAAALAGLKDHSLSREWMLRRIRMAGVYAAIELSTLVVKEGSEPTWVIHDRLHSLLKASESASESLADTVEFIVYVNRSSQAIARSLGILR